MGKVFKDRAITEITLRKFERPYEDDSESLIRKFCISIGLLQQGDSRDIIVDLFRVFLDAKKEHLTVTSKQAEETIGANGKNGVSGSNVRRQIARLENLGLLEKHEGGYRIREFMSVLELFRSHVRSFTIDPIIQRIEEYASELDKNY